MRKLLLFVIIISFLFFGYLLLIALPAGSGSGNQFYTPISLQEKDLAKIPVARLKSNMENGKWHVLGESFENKIVRDKHLMEFNMLANNGIITA